MMTPLSETKQQLLDILRDGEFHRMKFLWKEVGCLNQKVLQWQICKLRETLPADEMILCEVVMGRQIGYRLVKKVGPLKAKV